MRRAVFLDRDGVINRSIVRDGKPYPPATLKDFVYLPSVEVCIKQLRTASFLVIVVTNQPDVATGIQSREVVDLMHAKLYQDKLCDDIKVCYHIDEDGCNCRKPKSGMLLEAAHEWGISLKESFMVGDRWRDIEAGKSAGCFTYFIDNQYQEKAPDSPDEIVSSLEDATKHILQKFNSKDLVDANS
jgi:D-glycero-D-manno-heptose 1,7-bisphosphate phosphatase